MKEKTALWKIYLETACLVVFLLIISFIFLTKSPLHVWIRSDSDTDSSVFLTVAMMMDRGYMPYRDTFDHKGPLLYLINYLGRHISVYRGIWGVEFISMFVTCLLIYKIARLKCDKVLSCITLLISISLLWDYFQGGNLTEEYAMPFIAAALLIFLDYFTNNNISKLRLLLCGLCMGGVCLLRPNMISVWGVFCIAVLVRCIQNKKYIDLKEYIIFFMAGFFIIVIPFIMWLIINHSFDAFWNEYISFNFMYASLYGDSRWKVFLTFFNNPILLPEVLITVYLCITENHFLYGVYFCYIICTLLFICISRSALNHYGMILIPAVTFPIASLLCICRKNFSAITGKAISFFILIYFLRTLIMSIWIPFILGLPEIYRSRGEEKNSALVKEVCNVVRSNTQYDDKISVYGNWNIVYILSDRAHATKYSYQFPIGQVMPDIMQNYFDELEEQLPIIIVVREGYYDERMKAFLDDNDYSLIWTETENEGEGALIYKCKE